MSEIVLINPPLWEDTGLIIRMNPPLGILYLATILRKNYNVKVIDMETTGHSWYNVKERLKQENPKYVFITATSLSFPSMVKTAQICKSIEGELGHHIHTIIGGAHVSAIPEISLQNSGADCAIVGEGELVAEEALTHKGILIGKTLEDLDSVFPSWDLLEPRIGTTYTGNDPVFNRPEAVMLWSRGCPHRCTFCANTIFQHRNIKFRSPKNICDEIQLLRDSYGIRGLFVYDDELVGCNMKQTEWLIEVCDEIIKRGLNDITYKCQGRCNPNFVTTELLSKMKQAGFQAVMWGIESGSQRVLDAVKKDNTISNIEETIKRCYNNGIRAWAFLMIGNVSDIYCETETDAQLTVELVRRLKPYISYRQCTIATPYVGSELFTIATKNNWIADYDYKHWSAHSSTISYPHFPRNRMDYWVNQILNV